VLHLLCDKITTLFKLQLYTKENDDDDDDDDDEQLQARTCYELY